MAPCLKKNDANESGERQPVIINKGKQTARKNKGKIYQWEETKQNNQDFNEQMKTTRYQSITSGWPIYKTGERHNPE